MQLSIQSVSWALLVILSASLSSCSTDLEINAPYQEYTVFYAVFDKNETTHLVKINKSFLGEGNAFDMALVPDSSEFSSDELQAQVDEYVNGSLVASYPLNDTILTDRVPGTFYYPEQKMYTFNAALNEDADYEVVATVNGEVYKARTNIVNDFLIVQSTSSTNVELSFFNPSNGQYRNSEVKWRSATDGRRYEVYYRFKYREVIAGDTTDKALVRPIGNTIAGGLAGGEDMSLFINGQSFYSTIANNVPVDPNVTARVFDNVDLVWQVANDDLHVYLQLNEPVTGIVEDRPPFTNVTNGGLGIVVSRTIKEVLDKRLKDESLLELVDGPFTGNLKFCSAISIDPNLACP